MRRDITQDEPCRVWLDGDLIWDAEGKKLPLPRGWRETCLTEDEWYWKRRDPIAVRPRNKKH